MNNSSGYFSTIKEAVQQQQSVCRVETNVFINMSSIPPSTSLRLEALSDEILLEIFKYIKPIDLHSFVGHNRRIDNVVGDVKLNIVIQYPEEEENDLDYLMSFLPTQFIRLELRYGWDAFDVSACTELRSLTLNCTYLSENQFDQVLTVNLPYLERFSIDDVPPYFGKELLFSILDSERFPSLKMYRFSGEFYHNWELNDYCQPPNKTIHTFILNSWNASQLSALLNLLPNLHRFETSFNEPINGSADFNMPHMSLSHLCVTLKDPSNDLDKMLPYMTNLKQLRVTGKISENSVLEHFEKLAKIFRSHTPGLQKFDCELYFHAWSDQVDTIVIQQLHSLFQLIQCHLGKNINQCYTTDLTEYPSFSEYAHVERPAQYTTTYSGVMGGYDSDRYYDDDDNDNGWVDYGLGYRGNYKANYGSSPWSGNNDD